MRYPLALNGPRQLKGRMKMHRYDVRFQMGKKESEKLQAAMWPHWESACLAYIKEALGLILNTHCINWT